MVLTLKENKKKKGEVIGFLGENILFIDKKFRNKTEFEKKLLDNGIVDIRDCYIKNNFIFVKDIEIFNIIIKKGKVMIIRPIEENITFEDIEENLEDKIEILDVNLKDKTSNVLVRKKKKVLSIPKERVIEVLEKEEKKTLNLDSKLESFIVEEINFYIKKKYKEKLSKYFYYELIKNDKDIFDKYIGYILNRPEDYIISNNLLETLVKAYFEQEDEWGIDNIKIDNEIIKFTKILTDPFSKRQKRVETKMSINDLMKGIPFKYLLELGIPYKKEEGRLADL